jgi:hypothetical protein
MTSKTETGHAKNIANAGLLNTYIIQLGTLYKPSNPDLELDKLQAFYNDAFSAQQKVNTALPPYTLAVDKREAVFAPVSKKITKLRKAYKATQDVSQAQLEDFMTIARRLKGLRKGGTAISPDSEEGTQTQNSVSQMSYDQRTNNFGQLIELLQNTPNYAPNETEYQVKTLQDEKDKMLQVTQAVADTFIPLGIARGARNKIMYQDLNNLVDTFNKSKDYLFTILESNSPQYKAISKIKFRKA